MSSKRKTSHTDMPISKRRNTDYISRTPSRYINTPRLPSMQTNHLEDILKNNMRIYDACVIHLTGKDIWQFYNVKRGDYDSLALKYTTAEESVISSITVGFLMLYSLFNKVGYDFGVELKDIIGFINTTVDLVKTLGITNSRWEQLEGRKHLVKLSYADFV